MDTFARKVGMSHQGRLLLFYTICFALAPAILIVGFIELKYHFFGGPEFSPSIFILFFLVFLILFGIVVAIWGLANRPKD